MSMGSGEKIAKALPSLPQEIIVDILTRTTVKALSRFSCVSKLWLSTICSPKFIKSHREIPSANRSVILGYSDKSRPITLYTCPLDHYMMHYKSLEHQNLIKLEFDFDLIGKSPHGLIVVGSCNGLCCIATAHVSLILVNPSTRKWKQIPKPVFAGIDDSNQMMHNTFGLGYDDTCDDYKIVHLQPWPKKDLVLRIYSLRTNTWTKIETGCSAPFHRQGRPPFVNGKLHWMVLPRQSRDWIIMSYDLKTGLVGQLLQPCDGYAVSTFGLYKGCLCLEECGDIWIMSEYGVDKSWKKIASYCSEEGKVCWNSSSIDVGSDGMLDSVFEFQQQYNKNGPNYEKLEEVAPYIESLVSSTFEGDTSLLHQVDKARRVTKNRRQPIRNSKLPTRRQPPRNSKLATRNRRA